MTTHLGQQYPFLRSVLPPPLTRSFDDEPCAVSAGGCQSGSFDRILCDVPCSGDGTLVKPHNPLTSSARPPSCGRSGT